MASKVHKFPEKFGVDQKDAAVVAPTRIAMFGWQLPLWDMFGGLGIADLSALLKGLTCTRLKLLL